MVSWQRGSDGSPWFPSIGELLLQHTHGHVRPMTLQRPANVATEVHGANLFVFGSSASASASTSASASASASASVASIGLTAHGGHAPAAADPVSVSALSITEAPAVADVRPEAEEVDLPLIYR